MKRTLYYYCRRFNQSIREGVFIRLKSENGLRRSRSPLPGFSRETLGEAITDLIRGNRSSYPSVQWGRAAAMLDLLKPLEIGAVPIRVLDKEKIKIGHLTVREAIKEVEQTNCSGVDIDRKWEL